MPGALFGIASCDHRVAISRGQGRCGGNFGVPAQGLAQRSALDAIARGAFSADAATLCASSAASAWFVASAAFGGMGQSCEPLATNRGCALEAHREWRPTERFAPQLWRQSRQSPPRSSRGSHPPGQAEQRTSRSPSLTTGSVVRLQPAAVQPRLAPCKKARHGNLFLVIIKVNDKLMHINYR